MKQVKKLHNKFILIKTEKTGKRFELNLQLFINLLRGAYLLNHQKFDMFLFLHILNI